jgi:phosphoribosylamine-glycine ligase
MNILIIDAMAAGLDFALRCEAQGHTVKIWYPKDTRTGEDIPVGRGLVDIVANWQSWMKWADLIFLTDNARFTRELERYREQGYPIFGPNVEGTTWELERGTGQAVLEAHGIACMESTTFSNYDEAIAYLNANPGRYVSKPTGDADKALSYVAKSPEDMMFMLERWKRTMKKKVPFLFQKFTPGIEMAVGGWVGRDGFLPHFLENFEFKKLMPGEIGVNTGEMGCYDSESEVLTDSGWKYWPQVTLQDKIATLVEGHTVFAYPSEVVQFDYSGPMVCWSNQTLDIMVTPNHNMYVNRQHAACKGVDQYEFIQASDCTQSQYEIQRTAEWAGTSAERHVIPAYTYNKGLGTYTEEQIEIPMLDWARFLGFYIAEGSSTDSQVSIAQSHELKAEMAKVIMRKSTLRYAQDGHGFRISSSQVARHLKPLGRSWEKRVPSYIKKGSKEVITAFLEGYALGDGNMQPNGFRIFYTSDQGLADDTQELLLKIGRVGIVKRRGFRNRTCFAPDGHLIEQKLPAYEVLERVQKTRSWLDLRDRSEKPYKGKVYCATVPGHVMYVRRNGKPFWCGNTVMKYCSAEESLLAREMLLPLEAALIRSGYTGYIDVAVIIDKAGKPWPLEFTTRPGWPLFQIQQVLHGDVAGWMLEAVRGGACSFAPKPGIAVGVVVAIPDFPYGKLTRDEVSGYPIFGITDSNRYYLHPSELKGGIVNGKPMLVSAGNYLLTVSGAAGTVQGAIDGAYKRVKELIIPNSPIYRNDIGKRLETQLPELQALGYAESWEW